MSARLCHAEKTFTYEVDARNVPSAMREVAKIMIDEKYTMLYGFSIDYHPYDDGYSVRVIAVLG